MGFIILMVCYRQQLLGSENALQMTSKLCFCRRTFVWQPAIGQCWEKKELTLLDYVLYACISKFPLDMLCSSVNIAGQLCYKSLSEYLKTHPKERFWCKFCEHSFSRKDHLFRHLQVIHCKMALCHYCYKVHIN